MSIEKKVLGKAPSGADYEQYVLTDDAGQMVSVLNLGCILQQIKVKDRDGNLVDVAIGYDTVEQYAQTHSFFGAILGRYANRIGGARFSIDGQEYHVTPNERGNTLHGGASGFHNKLFQGSIEQDQVVLRYTSVDGEEGFPGNLTLTEKIRFVNGRVEIQYSAVTDRPTVVNISNHSFFNLNGQGCGDVLHHTLQLNASRYCAVDEGLIPTGILSEAKGTAFDFTSPKLIGTDIHSSDPMIAAADGYDVCYSVDGWDGSLKKIATAQGDKTGIRMDTYTDLPAVQLYTGMLLGKIPAFTNGKEKSRYLEYGGFCLETQNYPDAMNLPQLGNNVILRPGEEMNCHTVYAFAVE